jgi:putative flippase GtrA
VKTVSSAPAYRTFIRELLSFGFVGCVGTLIMIFGANLMRAWLGGSPVTSVVVPTVVSTLSSYLLNRFWTFRHRDSDGSGREVAIFFALNGVGSWPFPREAARGNASSSTPKISLTM